ncbi:MAG: hypothetical protein OHK0048_06980 [Rhodoferax sp.]
MTLDQTTSNPHDRPDAALHQLFSAAVGPVNTDDYVPRFLDYEANGHTRWGWHWTAGLWTLNWLLFRRLYVWAVGYAVLALLLPLLVLGWGRWLAGWDGPTMGAVLLGLVAFKVLAVARVAKPVYYSACRQHMALALAQNDTLAAACAALRQRSPTREHFKRLLISNLALLAALGSAVGLWVARQPAAEISVAPTLPRTARLGASGTQPGAAGATRADVVAPALGGVASAPTQPLMASPSPAASASALASASAPASALVHALAASEAKQPAAQRQPDASSMASGATLPPTRAERPSPVATPRAPTSALPGVGEARPQPHPLPVASAAQAMAAYVSRAPSSSPRPKDAGDGADLGADAAGSVHAPPQRSARAAGQGASKTPGGAARSASRTEGAASPRGTVWINVGLFAQEANARNVRQTLVQAGLPVTMQTLQRNSRTLTRVRVGPYPTVAQAQQALQRLKALDLDGVIATDSPAH